MAYTGALEDRFSVLRRNSYWAKDCTANWKNPQDLVYSTELPSAENTSQGSSERTLVYTWLEPVTVAEVFFLLTELSATSMPLKIKMADSE